MVRSNANLAGKWATSSMLRGDGYQLAVVEVDSA
jgi:hypothetical protein